MDIFTPSDSEEPSEPLFAILGYDPWLFPQFELSEKDKAFLLFGICIYETLECATILFGAKTKWASGIFRAVAVAWFLQSLAIVLTMVVAGFSFAGGTFEEIPENNISNSVSVIMAFSEIIAFLSRAAYIYATVKTTLVVFEINQTVKRMVYVGATLTTLCTLCMAAANVAYILQGHILYAETEEIIGRMEALWYFLMVSVKSNAIVMSTFNLVMKFLFLWRLFQRLDTPFAETIRIMLKANLTRRIFFSVIVSVTEVTIVEADGDLAIALNYFSMIFQTTTLAILDFRDSASIFKKYTLAGRFRVPDKLTITVQSSQPSS